MSTIGINGKVMHPGESNSFYQRALAHQHKNRIWRE